MELREAVALLATTTAIDPASRLGEARAVVLAAVSPDELERLRAIERRAEEIRHGSRTARYLLTGDLS